MSHLYLEKNRSQHATIGSHLTSSFRRFLAEPSSSELSSETSDATQDVRLVMRNRMDKYEFLQVQMQLIPGIVRLVPVSLASEQIVSSLASFASSDNS